MEIGDSLRQHWLNQSKIPVFRFSIYGVSVCVVNSHLAAHDHNQPARVESYNTLLGSHTYANKAGLAGTATFGRSRNLCSVSQVPGCSF
jgi:hypothetical protein